MQNKEWQGPDLIFDIDEDHLPGVEYRTMSHRTMLGAAKGAGMNLLVLIDDKSTFEDIQVGYSSDRVYDVHVRDEAVQAFDSTARRELVDYVLIVSIDVEELNQELVA